MSLEKKNINNIKIKKTYRLHRIFFRENSGKKKNFLICIQYNTIHAEAESAEREKKISEQSENIPKKLMSE